MSQELLYGYTHPEFYEAIGRYQADTTFRCQLESILPPDWRIERSGIWLHARNPAQTVPTQGFKLHIASTPEHATAVLEVVARECVNRGLGFKCTVDAALLQLLNSKAYDRSGSGKFMTIYPSTRDDFEQAAESIHLITKDKSFVGPYVLSDRRYKDSRIVYYRYGGMMPLRMLSIDGGHTDYLVAPSGELVRDMRFPFFKLPDWVDDPFGGSHELEEDADLRLDGRFSVIQMLGVTNRGGVYECRDEETGKDVVLKEARPHVHATIMDGIVIDSAVLLEREHRTLERLQHTGITPRPISLFSHWEHKYLAEERLPGTSLRDFLAKEENFVLPYILRPGVLADFMPRFKAVALRLVAAILAIHGEGVLVGDLSPSNVIVNDDGTELWLIDLESAVDIGDDAHFSRFSVAWNTPGFRRLHQRSSRGLEANDDWHATAVTLLSMFVTSATFLRLEPAALERILGGLVELGVAYDVATAVRSLSDGDVSTAQQALSRL